MTFIETVPEGEASGAVAAMYENDRETFGLLPNFTKGFSQRPEVYAAWRQLLGAIRKDMDARRYEIVTLAAASRLKSSYCSLAHGSILLEQDMLDAHGVRAIVERGAGLDKSDQAITDLAAKVATDATSVTQEDVDRLRAHGLSDAQIMDVVLAAAVRCFYSKVLDALGIEADARYAQLEPDTRELLTVGRAIEGQASER